jgi:hypothetical protein
MPAIPMPDVDRWTNIFRLSKKNLSGMKFKL